MGDMADELINSIMDMDFEGGREYANRWIPERYKACRGCGESGLLWARVEDRWRLVDKKGRIHYCIWS